MQQRALIDGIVKAILNLDGDKVNSLIREALEQHVDLTAVLKLEPWMGALADRRPLDGSEILPWGQRWIKLRNPDNLLIAIYKDQVRS